MSSVARAQFDKALADVEKLIDHHSLVTGGGRGKPKDNAGNELTRAGILLLSAAVEAFVEDLFDEAVDLVYADQSDEKRKKFKKATSRRLHNADVAKTNLLFAGIGLPWALDEVKWQKFSNEAFRTSLDELVQIRNKIAHGRHPRRAVLGHLKSWLTMSRHFADRLDAIVGARVEQATGTHPGW